MLVVGHRANQRYLLNLLERQHTVVFKQYRTLLHCLHSCCKGFIRIEIAGCGHIDIGIFEQSEPELQSQHVAHHFVDNRLLYFSLLNQFFQMVT